MQEDNILGDLRTRSLMANSSWTSISILRLLANDPDPCVRDAALANPRTPKTSLSSLTNPSSGLELKRRKLWFHLISKHAMIISPHLPYEELLDNHNWEHDGPGGIRLHPSTSRSFEWLRVKEIVDKEAEFSDSEIEIIQKWLKL